MKPRSSSRRHVLALPLILPLGARAAPRSVQAGDDTAPVLTVRGPSLGAPARGGRHDFDMAALRKLGQQRILTDTPWYRGATEFTGPLLREVLVAAGMPAGQAGKARCTALNDYRVDIPLDDARRHDVIVALRLNGKPMSVREKGPLFVIYPFASDPQLRTTTYYNRCIWQLRTIELVDA